MAQIKIYRKNKRTVVHVEESNGRDAIKMINCNIDIDEATGDIVVQNWNKADTYSCKLTELVDENDAQVATTIAEAIDYLSEVTGFNTASGGSGAQDPINYQAQNYTELSTIATDPQLNELAYCRESEGIKWLPWSLGGTYYPAGLYYYNGIEWKSDRTNITEQIEKNTLKERIRVDQSNVSSTLGGVIDSTKQYFIDGEVDLGNITIEVPQGGIHIAGFGYDISKLYSSENNYTMFSSPIGGSGNVLLSHFTICVDGIDSKVYELTDFNGFNALEIEVINYENCSSLGSLNGYRQGLEVNTGRFGGKPELELIGNWAGGFRISTSIVRFLNDGNYCIFKAGLGFVMNNRFLTDINVDLPANVKFSDFSPVNFPNPSTLQMSGALITRNGVNNPIDPNIFPNISNTDKEAVFRDCQGISNTFEGGQLTIISESATVILVQGDFYTINGTWGASDLQHFDNPSNGQLRHLGNNPREYQVNADLVIDGPPNQEIEVRLRRFDSSSSTTTTIFNQRRQVNSLVGGRDVAFFNIHTKADLDINDFVYLEIANNSGTENLTVELDSYFDLEKR